MGIIHVQGIPVHSAARDSAQAWVCDLSHASPREHILIQYHHLDHVIFSGVPAWTQNIQDARRVIRYRPENFRTELKEADQQ